MENVKIDVSDVDWKALSRKKEWLELTSEDTGDDLVVRLIEDIQAQASKVLGKEVVYAAEMPIERRVVVICSEDDDPDEIFTADGVVRLFIVKALPEQADDRDYISDIYRALRPDDLNVVTHWDENESLFSIFNCDDLDWDKAGVIELV